MIESMVSISEKRVFLSYAHENLDMVQRIYAGLNERKLGVWFDKEDLGPVLWKRKIAKAIPKSRYFIICFSRLRYASKRDSLVIKHGQIPLSVLEERVRKVQRRSIYSSSNDFKV